MDDDFDYRKFYDDEKYLLEEVGPRFRENGQLSTANFVMILVWKANRAVGYHVKRLKRIGGCSFDEAVSTIAHELHACTDRKNKLDSLIKQWEFALPTATAILAILYPDDFTVYDVVVCEEIDHPYKPNLYSKDSAWEEYEKYHKKVELTEPTELSLREKDRFLTGRSYGKWLDGKKYELASQATEKTKNGSE